MTIHRLKVALFCDREDWILGTTAREIVRCLGRTGRFDFAISSDNRIYSKPMRELKRLGECDLIHWIVSGANRYFGSLFSKKFQIATIHHCVDGDTHWPYSYKGINKFLTVSSRTQKDLIERGFGHVEVLHNGVNQSLFRPLHQTECRNKLDLNNVSFPLIGFFGKGSSNPWDRKGTEALVDTLREINRRRKAGILLSGEGWDGLSGRLKVLGVPVFRRRAKSIEGMPLLYGAIDLYLCSSRIEGGPVPVIEAMACEKPVVSTPVGHVPELIRHGENGLIVPVDDSEAMADAVEKVIDNPSLSRELGKNGRQTILKSWTWDAVLKPLANIYQLAIESGSLAKYSPFQYTKDLSMLLARSLRHRF